MSQLNAVAINCSTKQKICQYFKGASSAPHVLRQLMARPTAEVGK